ncbi:Uncharacterised protein [[Clostridium] sordellii]|uniref:hypothetical protein n=1 Tax=Paraclostridium sordellii TaxID=1505 RepID=UPI0005DEA613|nr:hypothetical protein [Paeniclostridium sordellii]MBX9179656.1 hypothetical protein [Paeniclostridium sordellii]CEO12030.1 Uncharacterised protein [[Clostridium] sordellii] [Paeniclostridium sordellii]
MIHDKIEGISVFSDQFTNTEIIDFRLNDIRSCHEEIREEFNKGYKFNILAVHYLVLRDANDIIIHCEDKISSRMLEKNLWGDYIKGADNDIIAYHIKKKKIKDTDEYIQDFSSLIRFQYKKTNIKVIGIYIVVILGLGALGGVVGNLISSWLGIGN